MGSPTKLSYLLDHIRRVVIADADVLSLGFSKPRMYRGSIEDVIDIDNPDKPILTFITNSLPSLRQARINCYFVVIGVYVRASKDAEDAAEYINEVLEDYKGADDNITIYRCQRVEYTIPTRVTTLKGYSPDHIEKLNLWETSLGYEIEVG